MIIVEVMMAAIRLNRYVSECIMFPLLLGCFLMNHLAVAQTLDDAERIVFLGDSITQSGVNPNGYVTLVR